MRAVFGLLLLLAGALPARAQLLAGMAGADVTPAVGVPLAGYGARLRARGPDLDPRDDHALFEPSRGVRDPIEAQALWLEVRGRRVALVSIDAIGVEQALVDDVARRAAELGLHLEPDELLVTATHTHSGPGALSRRVLWQLAACDRFSPRVHRQLVDRLARLVVQARAARRPARWGHGQAAAPGLVRNRRAGRSARVTEQDVDARLRLLRLVDAGTGQPLAQVAHLAVHGTCLGPENLELSADVPGAIRRAIAAATGCPTLFLNGCEGDVAPRPGGEQGLLELPERLGPLAAGLAPAIPLHDDVSLARALVERDVGPVVLHPGLAEGAGEGLSAALGTALRLLRRPARALGPPWIDTRFRFAALRLDDLVLLFVPGEPITELGRQLMGDAAALGLEAWVVGLANGHMGYVTTAEEYREGGYEAWVTFYGEDTGPAVRRALGEALERLAPR